VKAPLWSAQSADIQSKQPQRGRHRRQFFFHDDAEPEKATVLAIPAGAD